MFTESDMIELQNILRKNAKKITCAESCTGGLIASKITKISGSSDIFDGSIVSYSNTIKQVELNVKKETLDIFGAVSTQTVQEMLNGVINKFNSDFAIGVSGIAGPNGGTELKPVGTVVIGVINKDLQSEIDIFYIKGNRNIVQEKATEIALEKIFKFIKKSLDK